ncbi:MAG: hypothetical protein WCF84_03575, partial [Anaerolineae bacterium]
KERQPYRAQDADTYDQQTKARELRKLQKKAAKLGMQLVAVPAQAPVGSQVSEQERCLRRGNLARGHLRHGEASCVAMALERF